VIRFLDVHVHPPLPSVVAGAFAPYLVDVEASIGRTVEPMTIDEIAAYYRDRNGRAALSAWDAETASGRRGLDNDQVAALVAGHPDVFVGFGSVDPHKGAAAVAGINDAARLGMRGLQFHPAVQRFSPADRRVYPLWEVAEELRMPVLLHAGYTSLGAGSPGGSGIELGVADPMNVDRVAADFPRLPILLETPAWPWEDASLAVALHKRNVYLELSGSRPAAFPTRLLEAIRGPLRERTVFGSGFPFHDLDRWLEEWEALGLPADLSEQLLVGNAVRLLGLDDGSPGEVSGDDAADDVLPEGEEVVAPAEDLEV
jgi:predicted TIM-barrel fold metal-dependent hydrolase